MKTLKNTIDFCCCVLWIWMFFGGLCGPWVSLGDTGGSWAGPLGPSGRFLGVLGRSLGAFARTLGVPRAPLGVPG